MERVVGKIIGLEDFRINPQVPNLLVATKAPLLKWSDGFAHSLGLGNWSNLPPGDVIEQQDLERAILRALPKIEWVEVQRMGVLLPIVVQPTEHDTTLEALRVANVVIRILAEFNYELDYVLYMSLQTS